VRERETDRESERARESERGREGERARERERATEREKERERARERERERERESARKRASESEREQSARERARARETNKVSSTSNLTSQLIKPIRILKVNCLQSQLYIETSQLCIDNISFLAAYKSQLPTRLTTTQFTGQSAVKQLKKVSSASKQFDSALTKKSTLHLFCIDQQVNPTQK